MDPLFFREVMLATRLTQLTLDWQRSLHENEFSASQVSRSKSLFTKRLLCT